MLEQLAVATPPPTNHFAELAAAGVIFLTQIASFLASHVKGKKRDRSMGTALDARFTSVHVALEELSDEVRDVKAFVIGPDGQNGLRGDVKELKQDVKGILERERDRE
jgi:hypothetical protein